MKIFFTQIFILLSIFGYSQIIEHECPDGSTLKKQNLSNKTICMCADGKVLNGMTIIYDSDSNKIEENHWNKGVKTGTWKNWASNGTLIYEATYVKGRKFGFEKYYYSDGQLKSSTSYAFDIKNGPETFYFVNGNKKTLTIFSNNLKSGRIAEWNQDGIQIVEGAFINDVKNGIWIFRLPDFKNVAVVRFKDGKEEMSIKIEWTENNLPVSLGEKLK